MEEKVKRKKITRGTSGGVPREDRRPRASAISRGKDKVLRLRLGKASGEKQRSRLASAQDDGAFKEGAVENVAADAHGATKATHESSVLACAQDGGRLKKGAVEPGAGPAPATGKRSHEAGASGRTRGQALKAYWREVKTGKRERIERARVFPKGPDFNPLFELPEKTRSELFVWMRECPYRDAVHTMLKEKSIDDVTDDQIEEFFQSEAQLHWEMRLSRAGDEADALIRLAEESVPKFSAGMLTALGQEAFKMIVSREADPSAISKMATLFLKARGDKRADEMQELRREKVRHELQGQIEQAMERLFEEVEKHPEAQEPFDALRRILTAKAEEES